MQPIVKTIKIEQTINYIIKNTTINSKTHMNKNKDLKLIGYQQEK